MLVLYITVRFTVKSTIKKRERYFRPTYLMIEPSLRVNVRHCLLIAYDLKTTNKKNDVGGQNAELKASKLITNQRVMSR